ncbi:hypothetical protein DFR64_1275 [Pelolinea submarina]|uniref:Uncharacterized protein n=2 Tax=Pelolinea submarina TaxID=913107 RepID=A0A3E0AIH7_9CHLR|nr:hypothetical protein DFR64_1275 [Pelolinea submarina]
MTFEEINKKITALRITSIDFNCSKSRVILVTMPEYGFNPEFKDKEIKFTFDNCILFAISKLSTNNYDSSIEIVSWGKKKDCSIIDNFVSDSIAKDFNNFSLPNLDYRKLPVDYNVYFFENVYGDLVKIISKKVSVDINL